MGIPEALTFHLFEHIVGIEARFKQQPELFLNEMYRSFAALRMTTKRNVVILSAAKDLYEMCTDNILNPSPYLDLMTVKPGL